MPWELTVRSPTGEFLRTFTQDSVPNPLKGPPEVIVDPGGRTNTINLRARNDILLAPPRGIVEYRAWRTLAVTFQGQQVVHDGKRVILRDPPGPLAAGVIVTSPPLSSPGSGPADRDADALDRITAVGLEHLLGERIIGTRLFEGDHDVANIAYNLSREYAHPAIIVRGANFPNTGQRLGLYYAPEKTLADALDDLAASLPNGGGSWYVNASRELIFRAAA